MLFRRYFSLILLTFTFFACRQKPKNEVPTIGFVDAFEDVTLSAAKDGFVDALKEAGFSEDNNTVKIIYRNAQGDIPALTQIVNYFNSAGVDLLATCPTLSTITAAQHTKTIPVFMMVSPTAELMHLTGTSGKAPANLFGVSEDLAYIDTSFSLIPRMVHPQSGKLVVGMIYNQAEPQSVDALNRIKGLASRLNMTVEALPVTNSSEALLVTRALLQRKIDVFFANPDNVVFASFDTIVKSCSDSGVPVFTSEAGLVQRGAVAAFGADIYQWGHQAGIQAARYLKTGSAGNLHIEMVKIRRRMFNSAAAEKFGIARPAGFEELNR